MNTFARCSRVVFDLLLENILTMFVMQLLSRRRDAFPHPLRRSVRRTRLSGRIVGGALDLDSLPITS